jgi:hypothetical protein
MQRTRHQRARVRVETGGGFTDRCADPHRNWCWHTAEDVENSCTLTVTPEGLTSLALAGTPICRMQIELSDPEDVAWRGAADKGPVLVLGGDNIIVTDTTLDITAAASMGTWWLRACMVNGELPHRPGVMTRSTACGGRGTVSLLGQDSYRAS